MKLQTYCQLGFVSVPFPVIISKGLMPLIELKGVLVWEVVCDAMLDGL